MFLYKSNFKTELPVDTELTLSVIFLLKFALKLKWLNREGVLTPSLFKIYVAFTSYTKYIQTEDTHNKGLIKISSSIPYANSIRALEKFLHSRLSLVSSLFIFLFFPPYSSIVSIHVMHNRPMLLPPTGLASNTFFGILSLVILLTCLYHFSWDFSSLPINSSICNYSLVLIFLSLPL